MERADLIKKVLARMDEVSHADNEDMLPNPTIDLLLDDGVDAFLSFIPVNRIKDHLGSFDTAEKVSYETNATGHVKVPDDFIKLVSFKMQGWKMALTEFSDDSTRRLQSNKYLRGSVDRPEIYFRNNGTSNIIEYYSINEAPVVTEAAYIKKTTPEQLQADLVDNYCWFVAANVLGVMKDVEGEKLARQRTFELAWSKNPAKVQQEQVKK